MVRARAASCICASIPFGATHRVYFDTPPLKGCCTGTWVPAGEPPLNLPSGSLKFLLSNPASPSDSLAVTSQLCAVDG
jgi:hypothetical protein